MDYIALAISATVTILGSVYLISHAYLKARQGDIAAEVSIAQDGLAAALKRIADLERLVRNSGTKLR